MTQSKPLTKEQSTQSLISVLITIVIPACILIFFKEKPFISSVQLVLIALMFPFSYSIFEWVQQKNFFIYFSFFSVLLTGGIAVLNFIQWWLLKNLLFLLSLDYCFWVLLKKKPAIRFVTFIFK